MRISDWSSDVCSSDLQFRHAGSRAGGQSGDRCDRALSGPHAVAEEREMKKAFLSSVEEIIDEAKNGRMFILVDDEDRENEGDLVIPAKMATPDAINFKAQSGRGPVCVQLTKQRVNKQIGSEEGR